MTLEKLKQITKAWQLKCDTIVFTNGCFDLLHPGHLALLSTASEQGHRLVIGLNSDASVKRLKGESRPVLNEQDRALILANLLFVDAVVIFDEETPLELISQLKPDVLVKGGDYREDEVVGASFVKDHGGKVIIVPLKEGYSTSGLIRKLKA